ncbi:MAG: leucyl aminopeptidase [Chloroflexota bacterium]
MSSIISLNVIKKDEWMGGLLIRFAAAPESLSLASAGKEAGEVRLDPAEKQALVSLGPKEKVKAETLRRVGGALVRWLEGNEIEGAGLDLASLTESGLTVPEAAFALAEGLLLGAFKFKRHKTGQAARPAIILNLLAESALDETTALVEKARILADGTNLARELTHEPPNVINPLTLAEKVKNLAAEAGLKCAILDERQLAEMGAGAIVAVGKGSATPSRLIVLEHEGVPNGDNRPVALVGKAITFDTGGYSLKSVEGIVGMKYDKSGGMVVIAALVAAARLRLKTRIVGVVAAAENMISGAAYRPNDIIKSLSGKTIEIISTDAEGRLVLADALTYTQQIYGPRAVIDLATLTGGVITALGSVRAGIMSNDEALSQALIAAGENTYERLWPLPLDDEYFEQIKGDDSDIKNSGGKKAHPVIGGMFLKQFVNEATPWAHLDIAGVGNAEADLPYCPKGATGFGVRLLLEYIQNLV